MRVDSVPRVVEMRIDTVAPAIKSLRPLGFAGFKSFFRSGVQPIVDSVSFCIQSLVDPITSRV